MPPTGGSNSGHNPLISFAMPAPIFQQDTFMKGMTYAGFDTGVFASPGSDEAILRLLSTHTNWVAIAPGWYQASATAAHIAPDPHKTPSDASLLHLIGLLKQHGVRILLKPFVDSHDHSWRAHFRPADWHQWFESYLNFMLHYAALAQTHQLDMLCVGVENVLGNEHQQRYWQNLIQAVRQVYQGPLTYAANFEAPGSYRQVSFWQQLDYIGIDAYFSVSKQKKPSLRHILKCWKRQIKKIERWHRKHHPTKPILFTELGVSSYQGAAQLPWKHPPGEVVDLHEQARYYEAFFEAFMYKPWLRGVFWWWWDNPSTSDYVHGGKDYPYYYTPQGKPAEQVLRQYYAS